MDAICTHDGPTTVCTITADPASLLAGMSATGIARCRSTDVFVPEIGETIALGRAIKSLGEMVEQDGVTASFSVEDFHRAAEIFEMIGAQVLFG